MTPHQSSKVFLPTDINAAVQDASVPIVKPKNSSEILSVDSSDPSSDSEPTSSGESPHSSDTVPLSNTDLPPLPAPDSVQNPEHYISDPWKKDAIKRTWSIPVPKLNKQSLYDLSHPAPNWDAMDPYSGIEDEQTDDADDDTKTKQIPEKTTNYHLHDRATNPSYHRHSSHRKRPVKYFEQESDSDSDSDYDPKPKPVRTPNIGLRNPTASRIRAQSLITASKVEKGDVNEAAKFPRHVIDDREKDKQCPYCTETFYYQNSIQTHIDHAHQDIVALKGINNPDETGLNNNAEMGINRNSNVTPLDHMDTYEPEKTPRKSGAHVSKENTPVQKSSASNSNFHKK